MLIHLYSQIIVLDINDNFPYFLSVSPTGSIPENATFNTSITNLEATDDDIDANALLNFSIVDQGSSSGLMPFGVRTVGNVGEVFVNDPSAIDYETQTNYVVRVSVQDSGATPLSSTIDVLIDVIDIDDNNPLFPRRITPLQYQRQLM